MRGGAVAVGLLGGVSGSPLSLWAFGFGLVAFVNSAGASPTGRALLLLHYGGTAAAFYLLAIGGAILSLRRPPTSALLLSISAAGAMLFGVLLFLLPRGVPGVRTISAPFSYPVLAVPLVAVAAVLAFLAGRRDFRSRRGG